MNNAWSYQKFSIGRLIYPWLRPERIVMIFVLLSFVRDDFKNQYLDDAFKVFVCHCIILIVCSFADVLKKKIDTSNISFGNIKITEEDKDKPQ